MLRMPPWLLSARPLTKALSVGSPCRMTQAGCPWQTGLSERTASGWRPRILGWSRRRPYRTVRVPTMPNAAWSATVHHVT